MPKTDVKDSVFALSMLGALGCGVYITVASLPGYPAAALVGVTTAGLSLITLIQRNQIRRLRSSLQKITGAQPEELAAEEAS